MRAGMPLEGPTIFLQSVLGVCLIVVVVYWLNKVQVFHCLVFFGVYSFAIYILQSLLLVAISFGSGIALVHALIWLWTLFLCVILILWLRRGQVLSLWLPKKVVS
jgi:uncharacterized membrane protein YeiB